MIRVFLASNVLLAMLIVGCGRDFVNPVTNDEPDQQFSVAKSEVARENFSVSNENISKQAESVNRFAIAMYNQLKKEGKNLFLSPYSITAALAMLAMATVLPIPVPADRCLLVLHEPGTTGLLSDP